mgnify:CR=1 FL=1
MGFEVKGMEATIAKFQRAAIGSEDAIKRAVKAGGKLVAEKLQEKAPVGETKALHDSIKPGPVKHSTADGYYCEVKPVGNHPKTGEPLAKIGNVLEYGRSYGKTKKAGLGWFHPTVKAAEGEALAAMQAELEKRTGGG